MRLGRRSRGGTTTGCVEMEALSPASTCGGAGGRVASVRGTCARYVVGGVEVCVRGASARCGHSGGGTCARVGRGRTSTTLQSHLITSPGCMAAKVSQFGSGAATGKA